MLSDSSVEFTLLDGAMGTMLQKSGMSLNERPDIMNINAPDVVESIHRRYIEAGSRIICTNTFGSNAFSLRGTGRTPGEIIRAAVLIAKRASGSAAIVALNIGPVGELLEPMGDLDCEKAYALFKEQAIAGEEAGAGMAAIETMSDVNELEAAIRAVTENTKLPVFASMTFDVSGRTFIGHTPDMFVKTAKNCGAAAVGLNCSLEPLKMISVAVRIAAASDLPLIIKPNAGLPDSVTGLYSITPEEFAGQMASLVKDIRAGTAAAAPGIQETAPRRKIYLGGCCGTTPDYIRELRKTFKL